jgi:hypothetical protein
MPRFMTEMDILMSPTKRKVAEAANLFLHQRFNINEYFDSSRCVVCGDDGEEGLCAECYEDPIGTYPVLMARLRDGEDKVKTSHVICQSCTGSQPGEPIECVSLDCPWLYERKRVQDHAEINENIRYLLDELALVPETAEGSTGVQEGQRDFDTKCAQQGAVEISWKSLVQFPSTPSKEDNLGNNAGSSPFYASPSPN